VVNVVSPSNTFRSTSSSKGDTAPAASLQPVRSTGPSDKRYVVTVIARSRIARRELTGSSSGIAARIWPAIRRRSCLVISSMGTDSTASQAVRTSCAAWTIAFGSKPASNSWTTGRRVGVRREMDFAARHAAPDAGSCRSPRRPCSRASHAWLRSLRAPGSYGAHLEPALSGPARLQVRRWWSFWLPRGQQSSLGYSVRNGAVSSIEQRPQPPRTLAPTLVCRSPSHGISLRSSRADQRCRESPCSRGRGRGLTSVDGCTIRPPSRRSNSAAPSTLARLNVPGPNTWLPSSSNDCSLSRNMP
jgi:hypothetical protein